MLRIIGGLLIVWGILDFGLSFIGTELYGEIGIKLPVVLSTYSPFIVGAIGAALYALGGEYSTPYVPQTFDDENSTAPDSEDLRPHDISLSGQEMEIQRIEDMYEKSLINDEERTAMRKKVLGIE
jgi:hypothetical protein